MDENEDIVIIDSISTIKNLTNKNINELKKEIYDLSSHIEKKTLRAKNMNENILQLIDNQNNIIMNLEQKIISISSDNQKLLQSNKYFKEKIVNFEKVIKSLSSKKNYNNEINYDPSFCKKYK